MIEWIHFTPYTLIARITDFIALFGALFAFMAWVNTRIIKIRATRELERQNKSIDIYLLDTHLGEKYKVNSHLRRAELTRAEVMGILGLIPTVNPGRRYHLDYLHSDRFHIQINKALDAKDDYDFIIPCSHREIGQFILTQKDKKYTFRRLRPKLRILQRNNSRGMQ